MKLQFLIISASVIFVSSCHASVHAPVAPKLSVPAGPHHTTTSPNGSTTINTDVVHELNGVYTGPIDKIMILPQVKDGHLDFIDAISSAKKSIKMMMFHLSDLDVVDALKKNAHRLQIQIILDNKILQGARATEIANDLKNEGVQIIPSSTLFSITHAKTMIVDDEKAFITTINLTNTATKSRDVGIIVSDQLIVSDLISLFNADVNNANQKTKVTPEFKSQSLVVSPVNSENKIIDLISKAKKSIVLTVENLGDDRVTQALIDAVQKNAVQSVRVITPECIESPDPKTASRNYKFIKELREGLVTKADVPSVVVAPASPTSATASGTALTIDVRKPAVVDARMLSVAPYMHQKMIIIDSDLAASRAAFLGSENFSFNSLVNAREVGIVFNDAATIKQMSSVFESDFAASEVLATEPDCGAGGNQQEEGN